VWSDWEALEAAVRLDHFMGSNEEFRVFRLAVLVARQGGRWSLVGLNCAGRRRNGKLASNLAICHDLTAKYRPVIVCAVVKLK